MKRSTLYAIAAVLAVAALFFFMTTARAKVQCRVCMEYRGRTNCAAAVGPTEQAAREGAQSTACGPIASGMDQQIGCGRTETGSVRPQDRKSTRLNSSHGSISYAVFCLKKKNKKAK